MLTAERLREVLHYDPDTGIFTRKVKVGRHGSGTIAGTTSKRGYVLIKIDGGVPALAHRLAWLYMTREWPERQVDHWDMDKSNNRWSNLREATHMQNMANRPAQSNNSIGLKGVSRHTQTGRWVSQISVNKKSHFLGIFDCAPAAHFAYVIANDIHRGEFARSA